MANNENLNKRVPFVKNDPRINKLGAPKSRLLKDLLTDDLLQESNGITKLEAIINKLTTLAVKGDLHAIKEVLDRYAGKATQVVEATVTSKIEPLTDEQIQAAIEKL